MQQRLINAMTQIPDDIARLAHEQDLGAPQPGHTIAQLRRGWRWLRFAPLVGILCLLLAFGMLFISFNNYMLLLPSVILLAISYVVFLAGIILQNLTSKTCTLYPCDKGFILRQLLIRQPFTKFRVIRWDEIETIWSGSTRLAVRFYFKGQVYAIRCHDGETLTINGWSRAQSKRETLGTIFNAQFTRRRLPFLFADYQAGQTLNFGPLRVNREGIGMLDTFLPWEQVADISLLKDRYAVIYKVGEQRETWLKLPTLKIPNLMLLLALFKRVRSGQSEQEAGFEAIGATYGTAATVVQARGKIDALPDGLAMVAEEHRLGERRLDQNLGRSRLTGRAKIIAMIIFDLLLMAGVVTSAMISLSWFITGQPAPGFSGILIEIAVYGLFLIYFVSYNLVRNIQQVRNYTYTFEYGMLLKRKQEAPIVYRWEDIAVAWRVSGTVWLNRRQQATVFLAPYGHTFQFHSGKKYTLTRLNINQEALGKIIKEQVVPLQMPAITSAFQAGQTITFGTVQTDRRGITVGKRMLPWSQIRSVALQGSQLAIYDITQRKPWHRLQTEHIPNLFLLFALADYARDITAH